MAKHIFRELHMRSVLTRLTATDRHSSFVSFTLLHFNLAHSIFKAALLNFYCLVTFQTKPENSEKKACRDVDRTQNINSFNKKISKAHNY